jgi:ataxia telangiectasia mutated family protein
MQHYLDPAVAGLGKDFNGSDAGKVLHEYAVFCDKQLHDTDFQDDFQRLSEARENKRKEVTAYSEMIKIMKTKPERDKIARDFKKAKQWYELDNMEYKRLSEAKANLIKNSLGNYLKSLSASNDFDTDALRLFAVWLEHSDILSASEKVAQHIFQVPTSKFAILMNQLASILQNDDSSPFYQTVQKLIYNICVDHPYHTLHHIFAGINSSSANPDQATISRKQAMKRIAGILSTTKSSVKDTWTRIFKADTIYHEVAVYKDGTGRPQAGKTIKLQSTSPSHTLQTKVPTLRVPPATLDIPLRNDANYSGLPFIVGYDPRMSIAGGLSAPKIIKAIGSDGLVYKELVSQLF